MGTIVPILLCLSPLADAAAVASGRHWQLSIAGIECASADARVTLGMRIRYLGPKGPVEAPLNQLVDARGAAHPPKSLVWRSGSRELAQWLAAGGLKNVQSAQTAGVQLKFDVRAAAGDLRLAFGDVRAFSLTRKRAAGCEGVLKPEEIQAPKAPRPAHARKLQFRVYRAAYPCNPGQGAPRTIEANHPPHLPRQLLVFGHGYLPNAREVELPMGKAAAQSYAYTGLDELDAVDDAVRRATAADFPQYGAGLLARKYFAFNWGVQKTQSGNDAYSIGLYDLGSCPG